MYKRLCHASFCISRSPSSIRTKPITMKLIILVACALVAIAAAAPVEEKRQVQILRSDFNQEPEGGYAYNIETEDGVKKEETGELKEVPNEEGKPQKVVVVRGSFSYTDPEGNIQNIVYEADENGFRAEGPGIPKNE